MPHFPNYIQMGSFRHSTLRGRYKLACTSQTFLNAISSKIVVHWFIFHWRLLIKVHLITSHRYFKQGIRYDIGSWSQLSILLYWGLVCDTPDRRAASDRYQSDVGRYIGQHRNAHIEVISKMVSCIWLCRCKREISIQHRMVNFVSEIEFHRPNSRHRSDRYQPALASTVISGQHRNANIEIVSKWRIPPRLCRLSTPFRQPDSIVFISFHIWLLYGPETALPIYPNDIKMAFSSRICRYRCQISIWYRMTSM